MKHVCTFYDLIRWSPDWSNHKNNLEKCEQPSDGVRPIFMKPDWSSWSVEPLKFLTLGCWLESTDHETVTPGPGSPGLQPRGSPRPPAQWSPRGRDTSAGSPAVTRGPGASQHSQHSQAQQILPESQRQRDRCVHIDRESDSGERAVSDKSDNQIDCFVLVSTKCRLLLYRSSFTGGEVCTS